VILVRESKSHKNGIWLSMNPATQTQIEAYQAALRGLAGRGSRLRDLTNHGDSSTITAIRAWQEECGAIINQLSGGSKAHWLARSFSDAFLIRSTAGGSLEAAPPAEIIERLLGVLDQAAVALSQLDDPAEVPNATRETSQAPRRFDFVHNRDLRLVLEQAYVEGGRALDESEFGRALLVSAGILETIVTDALQYSPANTADLPPGDLTTWTFLKRLEAAEKAGLMRSGWRRLPLIAQNYRERSESEVLGLATEREARQCLQVLNVVMRDLNPGR
jgi:hypothetical protein